MRAANVTANAAANASVSDATALSIGGVPLYRQQQTLTCEESVAAMASWTPVMLGMS